MREDHCVIQGCAGATTTAASAPLLARPRNPYHQSLRFTEDDVLASAQSFTDPARRSRSSRPLLMAEIAGSQPTFRNSMHIVAFEETSLCTWRLVQLKSKRYRIGPTRDM